MKVNYYGEKLDKIYTHKIVRLYDVPISTIFDRDIEFIQFLEFYIERVGYPGSNKHNISPYDRCLIELDSLAA